MGHQQPASNSLGDWVYIPSDDSSEFSNSSSLEELFEENRLHLMVNPLDPFLPTIRTQPITLLDDPFVTDAMQNLSDSPVAPEINTNAAGYPDAASGLSLDFDQFLHEQPTDRLNDFDPTYNADFRVEDYVDVDLPFPSLDDEAGILTDSTISDHSAADQYQPSNQEFLLNSNDEFDYSNFDHNIPRNPSLYQQAQQFDFVANVNSNRSSANVAPTTSFQVFAQPLVNQTLDINFDIFDPDFTPDLNLPTPQNQTSTASGNSLSPEPQFVQPTSTSNNLSQTSTANFRPFPSTSIPHTQHCTTASNTQYDLPPPSFTSNNDGDDSFYELPELSFTCNPVVDDVAFPDLSLSSPLVSNTGLLQGFAAQTSTPRTPFASHLTTSAPAPTPTALTALTALTARERKRQWRSDPRNRLRESRIDGTRRKQLRQDAARRAFEMGLSGDDAAAFDAGSPQYPVGRPSDVARRRNRRQEERCDRGLSERGSPQNQPQTPTWPSSPGASPITTPYPFKVGRYTRPAPPELPDSTVPVREVIDASDAELIENPQTDDSTNSSPAVYAVTNNGRIIGYFREYPKSKSTHHNSQSSTALPAASTPPFPAAKTTVDDSEFALDRPLGRARRLAPPRPSTPVTESSRQETSKSRAVTSLRVAASTSRPPASTSRPAASASRLAMYPSSSTRSTTHSTSASKSTRRLE